MMSQPEKTLYPAQPAPTSFPQPPMYPANNQPYVQNVQPMYVMGMPRLTNSPQHLTCPSCRAQVISKTTYKSGGGTWLFAGLICLFGFWCGCQFIPFCIKDCKDCTHSCPNCNAYIGEHKMLS